MDFPDHPFWDFSLDVYARDGVAPACLALQDRHSIDVNVLLFCLWLGRAGHPPLDTKTLDDITDQISDWHSEVVAALRRVRRMLKDALGPIPESLQKSLHRRVQKVELEAEHVEQLALANGYADRASQAPLHARATVARDNLAAYLALIEVVPDEEDIRHAKAVLAGAFPDLKPDEAARLAGGLTG